MLGWALVFLIVALIAGYLGFVAMAGLAATIAKILFIVFIALLIVSFISRALRGGWDAGVWKLEASLALRSRPDGWVIVCM